MTKEELYQEIAKLGPEMSAGERMMKYFTGQEADCQPYISMMFDATFAKMWGYDMSKLNDIDTLCELVERKKDEYGMAGIGTQMSLRTLGEAVGSVLYYPGDGRTEYITDHFLKDYSQLKELEELDVRTNPVLNGLVQKAKNLKERFPMYPLSSGCPGPISSASSVRAVELMLRDVRRDPENLHKLLDLCVTKSLEWLKYLHEEVGIGSATIFDPVSSTDVLGKKYYAEFSKPYFKRLFDGMTEIIGRKPTVHICGHTKGIWGDLVEMGVMSFSVDDRENIVELKEMYGDKMTIVGNVSPVDVLRNGTIDDVIEEVKKQLREGADSPRGYMIAPGCEVPLATPKENLDAFIYAIRKYGAGAKIGCLPKGLQEE